MNNKIYLKFLQIALNHSVPIYDAMGNKQVSSAFYHVLI